MSWIKNDLDYRIREITSNLDGKVNLGDFDSSGFVGEGGQAMDDAQGTTRVM